VRIEISGSQTLVIENLLLDFNGTLAQNGKISDKVRQIIIELSENLKLCVATADTRGNASTECSGLPLELLELPGGMPEDEAKLKLLEKLGKDRTAVVGNGRNDALTLADATLGICVLGEEGAHKRAVAAAQVLVHSIEDALGLFVDTNRLVATLRY